MLKVACLIKILDNQLQIIQIPLLLKMVEALRLLNKDSLRVGSLTQILVLVGTLKSIHSTFTKVVEITLNYHDLPQTYPIMIANLSVYRVQPIILVPFSNQVLE